MPSTAARGTAAQKGMKSGAFSKAEDDALLAVLRDFAQSRGLSTTDLSWLKSSRMPGASKDDSPDHSEDMWGLKAQVCSHVC